MEKLKHQEEKEEISMLKHQMKLIRIEIIKLEIEIKYRQNSIERFQHIMLDYENKINELNKTIKGE